MAEIAGLVIGGVALAGLVDSSLNLISRVNTGRAFKSAYQDAALEITMLGARLARWEKTYREHPDPNATAEQGDLAESWLLTIKARLQDAYEIGKSYERESKGGDRPGEASSTGERQQAGIVAVVDKSRLTEKVRNAVEKFRSPGLSKEVTLADRTKWALADSDKMNELVLKISRLVTNIEQIFPSLEPALRAATKAEAAAIQPSAIDEPEEAIQEVHRAAAKVDARLGYTLQDLEAYGNTVVHVGDNIDSGFAGGKEGSSISMRNLKAGGNSNVRIGSNYNAASYDIGGNEFFGGPRKPPGGGDWDKGAVGRKAGLLVAQEEMRYPVAVPDHRGVAVGEVAMAGKAVPLAAQAAM
nr:hypothetical protein B0A51_02723 [Rachicladosporium sp. CCFEE 5018]